MHEPTWEDFPDELFDQAVQHAPEDSSDQTRADEARPDETQLLSTLVLPEQDPQLPAEQQAWREEWHARFKGDELAQWLIGREEALATFGPRPAGSRPSAPWPPVPFTARHTFTAQGAGRKRDAP